ncbi:hypothetical protein AYL99_11593 [Fonsecaea erecta]|uniref:Reverse transcriptase/retrotransposon-derived protein RNase H-like domain-containing protein n=1 Tax=Fonsecaea erecta TaxID=1367422 RepID=A0A178Z2N3_9EURO|nr:hypothetical protein AYL99_11593 [Fonsecaea erecta]OAP54059.1 hypothetical protein AYL99_11593 [Fonsecaea erecta]
MTEGISMGPDTIKTIPHWSTPRSVKDVRSFFGFCHIYRMFITGFSLLASPLNMLTKNGVVFHWTAACQRAFQTLKRKFITAPELASLDPQLDIYLESEASDFVVAGALEPVFSFSKNISPAECNYEISDAEVLAIVRDFEEWRRNTSPSTKAE